MGRWEPNARGRLVQAAMELYRDRGFEATTVAEIAKRAGLTERTFFRYFADKREVLFWGSEALRDGLVGKVDEAPASSSPFDAVAGALVEMSEGFDDRSFSRQRREIIVANPELAERELTKLASWASALAEALRRRGVGDPAAALAAEAGMAVFKIAFDRWVDDDTESRTLAQLIREGVDTMEAVTGRAREGVSGPGRSGRPLSPSLRSAHAVGLTSPTGSSGR